MVSIQAGTWGSAHGLSLGGWRKPFSHCSRISLRTPSTHPCWLLLTFSLSASPVSDGVRRTGLLTWLPLVQVESMSIWPRGDNGPLAELSIKRDLLSAFRCCLSRAITQRNVVGAGSQTGAWAAGWVRMETAVTQTRLSQILTVKQVFLQLDKHQHIYKTTYAGTSAGVSCFGPVSLLWLAVWSRPTASQTVSFCLSKWVYGISVTAQCGTCETFSKNSQHLLGCELYASLCVLLGLSGTVMFINPPTTQEIFCALESAHLVSIQGIKSWRGWDAAQSCGKAGLSLHVHLLHYTSPSYIH